MLTDNQWHVADRIAQALVKEETDVNELSKAMAYLRSLRGNVNAGSRFFEYLRELVKSGDKIGHSQKTKGFYQSIDQACNQFLVSEKEDPQTMLMILGWAVRLMHYYKDAPPSAELIGLSEAEFGDQESDRVELSDRQAEIAEVIESQSFEVGQVLEATVAKINKSKVTYVMLETIRLTNREPKLAGSLAEGQTVQVKITALKEDGGIKSVQLIGFP